MGMEFECFFTGHREIDLQHAKQLVAVLDKTIEQLIIGGVTHFRAGGALGFDTIAALKVIEKNKTHSFVRLDLYLPCRDQADHWDKFDREVYSFILQNADSVTYTSERYHRGCMHLRNRRMADGTDFCVAYCHKDSGGTVYTVNYARENGIKIINLAKLCDD